MTISILLMLIIAPLNILLPLAIQQKANQAPASIISSIDPKVEGAEKINKEKDKKEELFPVTAVIPQKKADAVNLVLPTAHAALILDANSGTVLMNQNGETQRQIASLTKLMTAGLVLENVKNLDEDVTIDTEVMRTDGTIVGCPNTGQCISQKLKLGEKISVKNLLTAMLMNSTNDTAVALAKHISGTEDAFVDLMNKKAGELGMNNTHFCTASGLEIEGRESECYSSALDVAKIAAYDMRFSLIWDIMKLPNNFEIESSDGTCTHNILNTDLIINQNLLPNCIGGKTGFTPLAGKSLMLAVSDSTGKNKIIAVLLDDPYRWQDIKTMANWAFASYTWQ